LERFGGDGHSGGDDRPGVPHGGGRPCSGDDDRPGDWLTDKNTVKGYF
jgi:hypothetical protein